ncbi:hypothetical protein, partial [Sheuella amnicola]|uniref:hypothetical protein n=1 Tax=Sheuella amnicola TaxID=2707330 RepID=UPI0019407E8B
ARRSRRVLVLMGGLLVIVSTISYRGHYRGLLNPAQDDFTGRIRSVRRWASTSSSNRSFEDLMLCETGNVSWTGSTTTV